MATVFEKRIRKRMAMLESLVKSLNDGIKGGSEVSTNLEETEASLRSAKKELDYLKESLDQANKYGPYVNLFWVSSSLYLGALLYKDLTNG